MTIRFSGGWGRDSEQKKARCRPMLQPCLSTGSILVSAILLAGCSQVPDAINPVEWYRGASDLVSGSPRSDSTIEDAEADVGGTFPSVKDVPERPSVLAPDKREDIVEGLVGDRENAKYTQDRLNRQGTPSRPLAPRPSAAAPVAEPSSSEGPGAAVAAPGPAATPATSVPPPVVAVAQPEPVVQPPPAPVTPPPAPVIAAAPVPASPASPERGPEVVATTPPATAPVAAPTPITAQPSAPAAQASAPAASSGNLLQDVYNRRLAEYAVQNVVPQATAPVPLTQPAAATQPVALPGSSQLLGSIVFSGRGVSLSPDGLAQLQEIARLQKEHGGTVRVIGFAGGSATTLDPVKALVDELDIAIRRADVVARQLGRLGVPGGAITASTAEVAPPTGGTEIYIDY